MRTATRTIFNVATSVFTTDEATAFLDGKAAQRQATAVTFLNAHSALMARRDKAYFDIIKNFTVFNDGIGLDIVSWLHYGEIYPDNLNGTDFIPGYLARTSHRFRIFLLGARPDVVGKTAARLKRDFPRHQIVGYHDGYSYREENIAETIKSAQADIVLVALGNPLQEQWIADNLQACGATLAFGVGGFFDFMSGNVERAPQLVRDIRSEWLYRLCLEPRRLWRRYLPGNFLFVLYAIGDAARYRLGGKR